MKLDVLVTTAHPDDAEAGMGGTLLKLLSQGKKVGIADFTRGELGTRGSAAIRADESAEADRRMALTARVNLGFRDGFFQVDEVHIMALIRVFRTFQPDIVFTNPPSDRHPDHGRAYHIAMEAVFLSGLSKIVTHDDAGDIQPVWRPKRVFHYIQSHSHAPQFAVDITPFWEKKIHVMKAYATQFYCPTTAENGDPATVIFHEQFWDGFTARALTMGRLIGATYAEGFLSAQPLKIESITDLI